MRQLLAHAADGESLLALVGGEAGVGKTRLSSNWPPPPRQGVRVLRGGCVPLGERACRSRRSLRRCAAWPTSWTGRAGAVAGPARAELARLLPDLAWGGEAATGPPVASRASQGRLFELCWRWSN